MKNTLLVAGLMVALSTPALAGRDAARTLKGLAVQGGNQKVIEAMKVLEAEGFLDQASEALSGDEDAAASEINVPGAERPQAPQTTVGQVVQIAFAGAVERMSRDMGGKVTIGQHWVKETTRGGRPIYEVKIMPESMGIVSFFVTYTVDVDKATMKVTRVK